MTAEVSVPALGPSLAAEPTVKISKPLKKGTKMRAFVDSKKHVDQNNENNNIKTHTC